MSPTAAPVPTEPTSLVPRSKREMVEKGVRDLISSGELRPGAAVTESDLTERFKVSATPVREALRLLEAEGVLVSEPRRGGKGLRVADFDPARVRYVYVMRRRLEPYAMRRATRRVGRRDLDQAARLATRMHRAYERDDELGMREANRAFHFLFYERCGFPRLVEDIRSLWVGWPLVLRTTNQAVPEFVTEHQNLLAAVEAGDLEQVTELTHAHILHGYRALVAQIDPAAGTDFIDPYEVDVDVD